MVVANLAEGEPASFKDQTLGSLRPHLILDGAALAVESVGAAGALVYVGRAHAAARDALRRAAKERRRLHPDECRFEVVEAPDRYTVDDLQGAARAQGTEFTEGDILLLRTGWMAWRRNQETASSRPARATLSAWPTWWACIWEFL